MLKLDKDHKISWSIEDKNKVSAATDKNSVTYPKIFTDTNLQYHPISDGLKENIILESSSAPNVFKFDLKFDGLIPEQQSDGTIVIKDKKTNESEFVFPKPFMTDKNNQTSSSVEMKISNTNDSDIYTLTVTADSNWLNDPSRAFPVTIDPSALTQNYSMYVLLRRYIYNENKTY